MELRRRLVEHRETLFELLALRAPRAVASPDAFDAPPLCSAARRGEDEIRLPGAVHERPVCSSGARDAGVAHCDGAASTASAEGAAGAICLVTAGRASAAAGTCACGRPAATHDATDCAGGAAGGGGTAGCAPIPDGRAAGGTVGADRCAAPQEHATDGALEGGPSDPDDAVRWLEAGVHGRAFVVDGAARWAEPCFDAEWTDGVPAPARPVLDASAGERVTAHWLERAAAEHAAAAAFARFTLDLVHFGAPPRLLAGAARAMGEEVQHARRCYAIASVLAGERIAPGPLSTRGAQPATSLRALLVATLREACVGEALGAAEAVYLANRTDDEVIAAAFRAIAADEIRHAALGWETIRWGLTVEREMRPDEVRAIVLAAVADVVTAADATDVEDDPQLARFGLVPAEARRAVYLAAAEYVVAPCCDAVLRAPTHCP